MFKIALGAHLLAKNLEVLLLGDEKTVALLEGDAVSRVLVVGREASRVCGLCDLGASDLLQGVDTLALGIESVHQMHIGGIECVWKLWKE